MINRRSRTVIPHPIAEAHRHCAVQPRRKKRTRWQAWASILLLLILLLGSVPLHAQEGLPLNATTGNGVLRVGNPNNAEDAPPFYNALCEDTACRQVTSLLFPVVFAVDPVNATYTAAAPDNDGLAAAWNLADTGDGAVLTVTLADGLMWSDGTPITAYDVFYSVSITGVSATAIIGVVPINRSQVAFIFEEYDCDALMDANYLVYPAHKMGAGLTEFAGQFFRIDDPEFWTALDLLAAFERFPQGIITRQDIAASDFFNAPDVGYGDWAFDELRARSFIRMSAGDLALEYVDVDSDQQALALFFAGELDLLDNPPRSYWNDLRANPHVQTVSSPALVTDTLAFNLADPADPLSAFDEEGNPQEQGVHPIFGDVRVRQAISLALDVDDIIAAAVNGEGERAAGFLPRHSWLHDDSLQLAATNRVAAEALLREAGWWQIGSIRECVDCLYAEDGSVLSFTLAYREDDPRWRITAERIAAQLRQVGIDVRLTGADIDSQRYDAFIRPIFHRYPAINRYDSYLAPQNDGQGSRLNSTSYNNPQVTALLQQADTLENCDDLASRADQIQQAHRLVLDEVVHIPLFTPYELVAVREDVRHFAPLPYDPYWNLADWQVWR